MAGERDAAAHRWLLDGLDPATVSLSAICARCARAASATGAGLRIVADGGADAHGGADAASDPGTQWLEDYQAVLGEGPSLDAAAGEEVLVDDLAAAADRWPRFVPEALAAGVGAVFAFPLRAATPAGVLTFYRATTGREGIDLAALRLVARALVSLVLSLPVGADDGLAAAVRAAASRGDLINQAAGIVSVSLGSSVEDALAALRAHAYESGRPLADVARAVVDHELRFT